MLKAVAFDLWETLITNTPEISLAQKRARLRRMEAVLLAHDHAAEAHRLEDAYRSSWTRLHELYWSADRDVPCRRQIEVFLEDLSIDWKLLEPATLEELERAYANVAVDILPGVVTGAREVLNGVRQRGLRTGLISNTGRTPGYALREVLEKLDLAPSLDALVFSDEHGACKPTPSIFEELRAALEVNFNEMLFIGDNLYVDILGAQRCGMKTVHFVPSLRGDAVAPAVQHEAVEPDAVIAQLRELPALLAQWTKT